MKGPFQNWPTCSRAAGETPTASTPDAPPGADRATVTLLVALAVVCTAHFLRVRPAILLLPPDATEYINWDVKVTLGYPAFLWLIRQISDNLQTVTLVQLVVFQASACVLAIAAARLIRYRALSVLLAASVMANPQLVRYCFTILTESVFMSCLMLHLAAALASFGGDRRSRWMLALAGVTIGIAIAIRPASLASYSLLISVPVLLYGHRARFRTAAVAVLAPVGLLWLAASTANYATRAVFATQVFGGYNLIGQTAVLIDKDTPSEHPELTAGIAADLKGITSALDASDSLWTYYQISSYEYNRISWVRVIPRIRDYVNRHAPAGESAVRREKRANAISQELGIAAARAHPLRYAYHVAAQLYGLWGLPTMCTPAQAVANADTLRRFTERFSDLSLGLVIDRADQGSGVRPLTGIFFVAPAVILVPVKGALFVAFVLSIAWLAALFARHLQSPFIAPLAYASATVHANYLLVASVQAGIPRYALSYWPVHMLVLFGSAALVVDIVLRARASRHQPRLDPARCS